MSWAVAMFGTVMLSILAGWLRTIIIENAPAICSWLFAKAVMLLPAEEREDQLNEWRSCSDACAGPATQLLHAFGCVLGSFRMGIPEIAKAFGARSVAFSGSAFRWIIGLDNRDSYEGRGRIVYPLGALSLISVGLCAFSYVTVLSYFHLSTLTVVLATVPLVFSTLVIDRSLLRHSRSGTKKSPLRRRAATAARVSVAMVLGLAIAEPIVLLTLGGHLDTALMSAGISPDTAGLIDREWALQRVLSSNQSAFLVVYSIRMLIALVISLPIMIRSLVPDTSEVFFDCDEGREVA
jgi:hypothetical protein